MRLVAKLLGLALICSLLYWALHIMSEPSVGSVGKPSSRTSDTSDTPATRTTSNQFAKFQYPAVFQALKPSPPVAPIIAAHDFSKPGVALILGFAVWRLVFKSEDLNNIQVVTARLSKHMHLPTSEKPSLMATVTDTSALKTPFLKEASNGDKIIVYEKARRVIIYRPSTDRIVDIGPIELSNIPKN